MSFAAAFSSRWNNVLRPALGRIQVNGVPLTPFRVDVSKASDSILTEILQAISDSAVIVADISTIGTLGDREVRNANVLYEVGIAHACRRPEEVILFRSDDSPLDFDVQGVRVHNYQPDDDPKRAVDFVSDTVVESLRSVESAQRTAVRHAAQRMTVGACSLLLEAWHGGPVDHPPTQTMGQILAGFQRVDAIELLLEVGAIEAQLMKFTPELLDAAEQQPNTAMPWLKYRLSAFGNALAEHLFDGMLPKDPSLIDRMLAISAKHDIEQG